MMLSSQFSHKKAQKFFLSFSAFCAFCGCFPCPKRSRGAILAPENPGFLSLDSSQKP
jgi:hypothetical protein